MGYVIKSRRGIMNKNGYTLIEVIITLSIMGILITLSVPNIPDNFGYLDEASMQLLSDVRYIQTEVMKNPVHIYKISVNKAMGSYSIVTDKNVAVKTVMLRSGYAISYTGMGNLYFNCDGTPIYPGTYKITDTKTNKFKEITVVVATGRTIILE